MNFLFFIERELHLPMLKPIMKYIFDNSLGNIGIFTFAYQESTSQTAGWGARIDFLKNSLDLPFMIINDPYQYAPDITFMADFSYQYTEGLGTIVNVGHGTISKGWFFSENNISRRENCADLICVPGIIHKMILEKQVFQPIVVTGMPKLDHLFLRQSEDNSELINNLGLDVNKKTILFAPTFNFEFSLVPFIKDKILDFIPSNCNLIIKMHGAAPKEWSDIYKKVGRENNNVFFWENSDISLPMLVSDLLITDYSSVIYEFIALGKPVVLFDSPKRFDYPNYSEDSLENIFRDVGLRFTDINDLPDLIVRSLENGINRKTLEIANKFISVKDGSGAKRVVKQAMLLNCSKKRGTIVINSDSVDFINNFVKIYSYHYQIILITNTNCLADVIVRKTNCWYKDIKTAFMDSFNNNILYVSEDQNFSPLFVPLMFAHLKAGNLGIVVPMFADDKRNVNQQFFKYYKKEFSANQANSLQITYSSVGEFVSLDYLYDSAVFATNKDFVLNLDVKDEKSFWMGVQFNCLQNNFNMGVALDCLIYEKNDRKKIEPFKKEIFRKIFDSENNLLQEVNENPDNEDKFIDLILFYYNNQRFSDMEIYAKMLPNNYYANFYLVVAMEKQNNLDKAVEILDSILSEKINYNLKSEVFVLYSKIFIKKNSLEKARDYIEKALKIDAGNINANIVRGSLAMLTNDVSKAYDCFYKVLESQENNVQALLGVAALQLNTNENSKCLHTINKVLDLEPDNINAINILMKLSYNTSEFNNLIIRMEKFLDYHPANIAVQFALAGVYVEKKEYNKAIILLDSVLLFEPSHNGAVEMLDKIKFLTQ